MSDKKNSEQAVNGPSVNGPSVNGQAVNDQAEGSSATATKAAPSATPPRGHFYNLEGLSQHEQLAANTREFTGDGTPYLPVPGLQDVSLVRVGMQIIPREEVRNYPVDATHTRFEQVSEPLISLQQRADGTPVLLRSILSNNGIWQSGVKVYVTGQWQDGGGAAEATTGTGAGAESPSGSRSRK